MFQECSRVPESKFVVKNFMRLFLTGAHFTVLHWYLKNSEQSCKSNNLSHATFSLLKITDKKVFNRVRHWLANLKILWLAMIILVQLFSQILIWRWIGHYFFPKDSSCNVWQKKAIIQINVFNCHCLHYHLSKITLFTCMAADIWEKWQYLLFGTNIVPFFAKFESGKKLLQYYHRLLTGFKETSK